MRPIDIGRAVALLATLSCATPYQRAGLTGGYEDARLDSSTFKVAFSGNGHTSRPKVEAFLKYRCAELTLAAEYDYFVVLQSETEVVTPAPQLLRWSDPTYNSIVLIKVFKGPRPLTDPAAFDAREVIGQMQSPGAGQGLQ